MNEQSGTIKAATINGVPLFIHWSLPVGGLLLSLYSGFKLVESFYYCIAFFALITFHEFGHFAAARSLGLQVFSVTISGLGGQCKFQSPRKARDVFLVFSAGLIVQCILLALTILFIVMIGMPHAPFGKCVVNTFTFYNVLLIVINLIPAKTKSGISTDGNVLWQTIRHALKRGPHPFPNAIATTRLFPPDTSLFSVEGFTPHGFTTGIEILNDTTTPMEFVVATLTQHLQINRENAIRMMMEIHKNGGVLVSIVEPGKAEAIATAISNDARDQGHKLICRAVDIDAPRMGREIESINMDALNALVRKWRLQNTGVLPRLSADAIESVFAKIGSIATEDIIRFFCCVGGMTEMDNDFWRLWTLQEIVERNEESSQYGILFSDHTIDSWCYRLKPITQKHSSVYIDHFDPKRSPIMLFQTLDEFIEAYEKDPESIWG